MPEPVQLAVMGSTGSIGDSTLRIVKSHPDRFRVFALACKSNTRKLAGQIRRFNPSIVAVGDSKAADRVRRQVGKSIRILTGEEGLCAIASHRAVQTVVMGITGAPALVPSLSAAKAGKRIALANKECLVMAGELLMRTARKNGALIMPVDSEQSAIFQCMGNRNADDVRRILLTASGGPFFNWPKSRLRRVVPAEALRHPRWDMGPKVTIDSATLMNKGLEFIETCRLFNIPPERVEVIIHPQSIIHSMVEFNDRSILAQLAVTDMRLPIFHALSWPHRPQTPLPALDPVKIAKLTFHAPDLKRFPCLKLAMNAARTGGIMPAVMNAANEEAVEAFINGRIGFMDIPACIETVMKRVKNHSARLLTTILKADLRARELFRDLCM